MSSPSNSISSLLLPLTEPNFVSSYDIGNFTYFFFRENAVEHDCGRTVFSRAGRVCKNDIGGRFLLEDTWTTFMKARLNCSRPGEIPFNYNELQGTFYLPELELLYGIFTTNVWVTWHCTTTKCMTRYKHIHLLSYCRYTCRGIYLNMKFTITL